MMPLARYLAMLSVFMALPGCPKPTTSPDGPSSITKIIDCSEQAVRDHGIQLLPAINDCLAQSSGWAACLGGLVQPAIGVTEEVVACATRAAGRAAARTPSDSTSSQLAAHAADFLKQRGYKFTDGS